MQYAYFKPIHFLYIQTNYNWTPLCYSVSNGHTDVALLLLQADADPNYITDFVSV